MTIGVASHSGAKERFCSRIQRSPTRTQRESSNAKFHYQWHERVVFCFGLLTCIMLTRLIIFPMTHISLNNEARLIETFSLLYLPFPSLFPALNKQTYAFETGQRATPTVDQPILTLAHQSFPAGSIQDQSQTVVSARKDASVVRSHPTLVVFRVSSLPIWGRSGCLKSVSYTHLTLPTILRV